MFVFDQISSTTVLVVMLATFIMLAVFYCLLYLAIHRKKSMLILFLASIVQLLLVSFLYLEEVTGDAGYLMMSNMTNVALVTLWAYAIFVILGVKTTSKILIALNALNVIQAFAFYLTTGTNHIVNILSAVIIAFISIYCSIKIASDKKVQRRKEIAYTVGVMSIFAALNIIRAVYRALNPMHIATFSDIDNSAAMFLIISLAFSYVINFLLLFLNFNDLVLRVQELSNIDTLTNTLTRNTFLMFFEQKLSEIKRKDHGICAAILDIDDFKRINDSYGHLAGDETLARFTSVIKSNLRESDIIGRFGGEEFIIILEAENADEGLKILYRIKEKMSEEEFVGGEKITFSCGQIYIECKKELPTPREVIKAIDKRLYQAKAEGKNKII